MAKKKEKKVTEKEEIEISPSAENAAKLQMLLAEKQRFAELHNIKMEFLSERILRLAGIIEDNAALSFDQRSGDFKAIFPKGKE
jgi:hypothetical protein